MYEVGYHGCAGGIPLFEKIIDQPLIQQIKQMEQLNSTVRVGLFVRSLGPRSAATENEPSAQEDHLKPLDGLEAEHLEEVGTLGVLKGFSVGVNEQGQEVVCSCTIQGKQSPMCPQCNSVATISPCMTCAWTQQQLHSAAVHHQKSPCAGSCRCSSPPQDSPAEHIAAGAPKTAVPAHSR